MKRVDHTFQQVKIVEIIKETEGAKTFVLEPLNGWQPEYKAGQFLTLVFPTSFGEKRRSYSFSSSPEGNEPLSITVKKVDNGEFSRWLLDKGYVGQVLQTSGVSGFFRLPEKEENVEQLFFLAAGSGITPCYSMIKTLLFSTTKKLVLIYSNRSEKDTIFLESLKLLQERYPARFHIRFLNSNSQGIFNRRLSKWLLTILMKEYLSVKKEQAAFYLCGPFEYMQMIGIVLLIEGIESRQIHKEVFMPLPKLNVPVPADTKAHKVTVHIGGHHYILEVQYPKTILATAKEKNITLPYSCEAGICGTCAATCVKGKVWMSYNGVLMDKEIEKGRILTCQGFAVGGDAEILF